MPIPARSNCIDTPCSQTVAFIVDYVTSLLSSESLSSDLFELPAVGKDCPIHGQSIRMDKDEVSTMRGTRRSWGNVTANVSCASSACVVPMPICMVLTLVLATPTFGQAIPEGEGVKAEYLAELSVAEDHLVRLAEAMPADLYQWRPDAGVRSVSEVLLHIASSNLNMPRVLGFASADGMVGRDYQTSETDKTRVVELLKESFVFLRQSLGGFTPDHAEMRIEWFGGENTMRGALIFMTRHTGEHTGQLVAYARMNGIVPPWSAADTGS